MNKNSAKKIFGFKLCEDTNRKLERLASINRLSRSQVVERLIDRWNEEMKL